MIPMGLPALANHLWQSTLFGGAAWLLTLALRNNRAAVRYWIWLAVSAKFLVPFSLLLGVFSHLEWQPPDWAAGPQAANAVGGIGRSFAPVAEIVAPPAGPAAFDPVPMIVFGVWLCGAGLGLIFWLRAQRQVRAIRRAATPLDFALPVPVLSSSARLEPGVFGIFKPVLILPVGIEERLTRAQLEAVLAHELCHVRRRDNLTAAIHLAVETICWFHPLVWWIRAQLVAERERACDEEVVRQANDPHVYAEAILNVCKLYLEAPLVCVSGVTGANLRRRIEAILANRGGQKLNRAKKLLLASAGAAALAGPVVVGALVGIGHAPAVHAQQTEQAPRAFEAASIKPNRSGRPGGGLNLFPARIRMVNSSLKFCIQMAWDVKDFQVTGGPGWADSDRYDIDAVAASPFQAGDYRVMLQALLSDRFGLAIHRATQDRPGYALVAARSGAKLPPPIDDPDVTFSRTASGDRVLKATSATMSQLGMALSSTLGAIVVDQTGIEGRYDVSLQWTPEAGSQPLKTKSGEPLPPPPPDAAPGLSIFLALQQKLGLKLEARKVPVEVIVIDRASRPPDN